jgi:hypothetical protein
MKKVILLFLMIMTSYISFGQITTSTISGMVKDQKGETIPGTSIHAVHDPTGTNYYSVTNKNGVFVLPAVRVGGPYTIHATFIGFNKGELKNVATQLGNTTNLTMVLIENTVALKEVVITAPTTDVFSKDKTGASQQFSRRELQSIPVTGARTIESITKYNAFGDGRSFGAQDSRLNNFTIDGSQFNNNFGLGSSASAGGSRLDVIFGHSAL